MDLSTEFRILCPAARAGAVIGRGGSVIRRLEFLTGAKIRVLDPDPPNSPEERLIVINAGSANNNNNSNIEDDNRNTNSDGDSEKSSLSVQQKALVRVFERIVRGDDAIANEDELEDKEGNSESDSLLLSAVCRMLVRSDLLECLFGRAGGIWGFVDKIKLDTGAQIRVLPRDRIPACASPADELVQTTGNYSAVKKALLSFSRCLHDVTGNAMPAQLDPFSPRGFAAGRHVADFHRPRGFPPGPRPDIIDSHTRMVIEEEVVFKLLCQADKAGSLIGKGGSVVRALEHETGASIQITDAVPDAEERVVVICARESLEQNHSPAQDAVIRVQNRIAEVAFEPGAAVLARVLVHSQQIGCLLGKGGAVITEMRRATGASIRVFQREQLPRCAAQNDEVVQVIGSLRCVQDALFKITSRLRETFFPPRSPPVPGYAAPPPPYMPPYPDMPPHQFRPRHNPTSPGSYPPTPVGSFHHDRPALPPQPHDHMPPYSHVGPPNIDRGPYHYGSDWPPGQGPPFETSPRSWKPQSASGHAMAPKTGPPGSSQGPISGATNVEVVIPQNFLAYVYGESNSNLHEIKKLSGANVVVNDQKADAAEGIVVITGTPEQVHIAQTLTQGFILNGRFGSTGQIGVSSCV
ncbi:hypothetical protein ACFE04_031742 [Oxalis oulophora]